MLVVVSIASTLNPFPFSFRDDPVAALVWVREALPVVPCVESHFPVEKNHINKGK
jgi:hypothetical protein